MAENTVVTVILRDPTTGIGLPGQIVKLRHITDSFASDVYTLTDVPGKPGAYQMINPVYNLYKLWVNTVEDTSFAPGSDAGRILGRKDDVLHISSDGHWDALGRRLNSVGTPVSGIDVGDVNYNDARYANKTTTEGALATKVSKTGAETISDIKTFEKLPEINDPTVPENGQPAGVPVPSKPEQLVPMDFVEKRFASITIPPFPLPERTVLAWNGAVDSEGKIYNSLYKAAFHLDDTYDLDYNERGTILMQSMGTSLYMVAVQNTLKNYISFVGHGAGFIHTEELATWKNAETVIFVCDGNSSTYNNFSNCLIILGGGSGISGNYTGDRTWSNKHFENCVIYTYKNWTLNVCTGFNNTIINATSKSTTLGAGTKLFRTDGTNILIPDPANVIHSGITEFTFTTMPKDPSSGIE